MWGFESYDILDRLQLRFCKFMLSVNKYTCSNMIYGEFGVTYLNIDVNIHMVLYWAKLVRSNQNKISNIFKSDLISLFKNGMKVSL